MSREGGGWGVGEGWGVVLQRCATYKAMLLAILIHVHQGGVWSSGQGGGGKRGKLR